MAVVAQSGIFRYMVQYRDFTLDVYRLKQGRVIVGSLRAERKLSTFSDGIRNDIGETKFLSANVPRIR